VIATDRHPHARFLAGGITLVAVSLVVALLRAQEWRDLTLASFDEVWETVRTTYYDPSLGGLDWPALRREFRPRVEAAQNPQEARAEMRSMLARLRQSHFTILAGSATDAPKGTASPAVQLRVLDRAVVLTEVSPGGAAAQAGLRPGDQVLQIGGRDVESWRPSEAEQPDPRVAAFTWWRALSDALLGEGGTLSRLRVRTPAGVERELSVLRENERGEIVALGNLPPLRVRTRAWATQTPAKHTVGVIAFNMWLPAIAMPVADAIDAYRTADGLIIDLRGNPGGLAEMIRGIAGHLLAEPALIGRMRMRETELEFRANPRRSTPDGRSVEPFAGPVAIVIDELTGSSSECFAGGLQSLGRARVFGTTSMGQALPAATRQLPNGDVLVHVVGDFVTSTGRRLEGAGVVPDEPVPLTVESLASGRDAPVEAALRWIDRVVSVRVPTARP
jgi:carboxyl-terminal processing protease